MKKWISAAMAVMLLLCLVACGTGDMPENTESAGTKANTALTDTSATEPESGEKPDIPEKKALILYFSCTGTTKNAAEEIQRQIGADILAIIPSVPYTSADLNYNGDCRANREQNDASARPATATALDNLADYDTVFIGFPIWWGTMPKIINTVLDTYDFSGKTIVPFCTSGSSGISVAVSAIRAAEPDATVEDGLRVGNLSQIAPWIDEMNLS